MQKNYFLVAVVVSLILLGGIFLRSRERFEYVNQAQTPFAEKLYKEGGLSGGSDKGRLALDRAGHLLVLFEEVMGEWAPSRKELIRGSVFISGSFINPQEATPNATKASPEMPYIKLAAGEVLSGKLLIRFGKGSVLIERNEAQKSTRVYADDQEVDVFFEGRSEPFVIPSGMRITVFDDQVSENTKNLYYSKLRKKTEFRLESFINTGDERLNIVEAREKIKKAKQQRQSFLKKLETFTKQKSKAWQRDSGGLFGGVKRIAQTIQQTFDFITLPRRKQLLSLNKQAKDFFLALNHLEDKDYEAAQAKLDEFQDIISSEAWAKFLTKNPEIADEWDDFAKAQRAVSQHSKDEANTILYNFWFNRSQGSEIGRFRESFTILQRHIAQKSYGKASESFDRLILLWNKLAESHWEALEITRYRRLVSEILHNIDYFKDQPNAYELLRLLAQKESISYQDEDRRNEITLELTQNTLDFIYRQVSDETLLNDAIMSKLQQLYKGLALESMIGNISRNKIFSSNQLNMITLLNKVGTKPLTRANIEALQTEDESIVITQQQYEKEVKKDDKVQDYDFKQVASTKDLRSYFVVLGASTSELLFPPGKDPNYISFENLYFNNRKINGGFHIEGQFFDNCQIGGNFYERLSLEDFNKALYQSKLFASDQSTESGNESAVPQTTARARFERLLLQKKIKNLGLEVAFDSIKILDKEADSFSVEGVTSGNQYRADFVYRKNNQSVERLYIQFGGNTRKFDKAIPFRQLKEVLDEASVMDISR